MGSKDQMSEMDSNDKKPKVLVGIVHNNYEAKLYDIIQTKARDLLPEDVRIPYKDPKLTEKLISHIIPATLFNTTSMLSKKQIDVGLLAFPLLLELSNVHAVSAQPPPVL